MGYYDTDIGNAYWLWADPDPNNNIYGFSYDLVENNMASYEQWRRKYVGESKGSGIMSEANWDIFGSIDMYVNKTSDVAGYA